jgi:hypothetical protein
VKREDVERMMRNASRSVQSLNPTLPGSAPVQDGSARTPAKLESNSEHGTMGAIQVQKGACDRFLVRVTSYRKRLLDQDNLCEKFHVDLLRYAGVIPTDAPGTTQIEVRQEKAGKAPERTVIEVFQELQTQTDRVQRAD